VVSADGSVHWLQWKMRTMPARGVVYGAARDVTENRRAETELREAQRTVEASRDALRLLADEQAALRRVATVVAREPAPAKVFAAVAEEVGRVLRVGVVLMFRFEGDGTGTVVAYWGDGREIMPVGTRSTLEGENLAARVLRTAQAARIDDYSKASGTIGAYARRLGVRSGVGTPIIVDGGLWGAMIAVSRQPDPLPVDTEARIGEFTQLVATAISNIEARAELARSRSRIVAATDEERRRMVRDLHDGAQQRLVHTVITLKLARRALDNAERGAAGFVGEALEHAERAMSELRELTHGILPSALARGGLRAGVDELASRMPLPVRNGVSVGRLPAAVESTAYFVVSEALTNVAKHARAARAEVTARIVDDTLAVHVRDDGVGGARPEGSGLVGLADRLAALDGRLRVDSPAGGGTVIAADIPIEARRAH
jgi:signal transduction histidine kinase